MYKRIEKNKCTISIKLQEKHDCSAYLLIMTMVIYCVSDEPMQVSDIGLLIISVGLNNTVRLKLYVRMNIMEP